jgi:hypothetical protein
LLPRPIPALDGIGPVLAAVGVAHAEHVGSVRVSVERVHLFGAEVYLPMRGIAGFVDNRIIRVARRGELRATGGVP